MKKFLYALGFILFLFVLMSIVTKGSVTGFAGDLVTQNMFVSEDKDRFDPGLQVGEDFPLINASLSGKQITTLNGLSGRKGTVFVVSRSIVWCPYCMKQMAELNQHLADFEKAGIAVIGLSYDSHDAQQSFLEEHGITYSFLSDNEAQTVKALGILNTDYSPGQEAYGIGHPGAFVLDAEGKIVGKIFLQAYSTRVDGASLLNYAKQALDKA